MKTKYFKKRVFDSLVIFGVFVFLFTNLFHIDSFKYVGVKKVFAATEPIVGSFSPPRLMQSSSTPDPYVPQPDPRSGDLMIAFISLRPANATPVTLDTPSGWTLLWTETGSDGNANAPDAGDVVQYVFSKVADGTEGISNQTFTKSGGSGSTSAWGALMMQFRSATGTYDVAASGFDIDGDTTSWSSTLDSDIGLTEGDLVVIFGSQNGNLANSSGQNITATGITAKSTVREHGEYSTNTGNDLEFFLADTLIWTGTNTVNPTLSTTMSAATSGVLSAVRIRQGSGTRRTDTWVRGAGAQVAGTTSVALPYPAHSVGDILIATIATRNSPASPVTPANWTAINTSTYTGGFGTEAADSGTTAVKAFYREVTSLLTGTQSFSVTNGNGTIGQIISVHKDDADAWTFAHDGGSDDVPGTSWSVTGSGIDLSSDEGGDVLLALSSVNTDLRVYSNPGFSASGITFGEATVTSDFAATSGNDLNHVLVTGRVSSGNEVGVAPTFTMTANASAANNPAGATMFIKVIGHKTAFDQSAYRFFENANSTDVGSALASQDTPATLGSSSDAFRLRALVNIENADLELDGQSFKLQFSEKSGTCDTSFVGESYSDVTGATVIAFNNNASPSDGDNLTANANDPTNGGNTIVNQDYEEANNFTNSVSSILVGQDGKWDFSLIDNGATADTSYCFRIVKSDGTELDTYSVIPEITTASVGGSLTVDIVDAGGASVGSPSISMSSTTFSFSSQTTTGTLGVSSEKIRVDNSTGTATWNLNIAATGGSTAFWDGASSDYDFNDPTASAGDGGDVDSLGGQMTINPSLATITPEGGCTTTNLSLGSNTAFSEGVVDSINIASAASGADTGCYWDFTGIGVSQTIPPEQGADSYTINMTVSVVAS